MLTAELLLNSPHMLEKGASESWGLYLSLSPWHWDSKLYLSFYMSSGNPVCVLVLSRLNPRALPTKLSTPVLLSEKEICSSYDHISIVNHLPRT